MIEWPESTRLREVANPEPVEAPAGDTSPILPGPAVESDTSPSEGIAAPALPAATPLSISHRKAHVWSASLLLALGVSAAVHASVIALLGERIAPPGVEASANAVSVEIVLDAPDSRPVAGGDSAQQMREITASEAAPEAGGTDETEPQANNTEELKEAIPEEQPVVDAPAPRETASATKPEQPTELPPEMPEPASVETVEAEAKSDQQPDSLATAVLPQEDIPLPTPRPQRQATKQARGDPLEARQKRAETLSTPRRQEAALARNAARTSEPAHRNSAASTPSRQGGATAGEKATYSRKLLNHVERHKRYPREAARLGIAGAAGLSITIDRQGRLAAARLSRRSGHSILDEEALAVARRAAPYPRPPSGIGGGTITFSVTLRFSK